MSGMNFEPSAGYAIIQSALSYKSESRLFLGTEVNGLRVSCVSKLFASSLHVTGEWAWRAYIC